jgi:hypothetical protein
VAKEGMICPFSNALCEECALYRGRHYYLCFCREYRGYLGGPGEVTRVGIPPVPGARPNGRFEIPPVIRVRAIDPFVTDHDTHPQKED